ncbi:hypothetical protein [Lewinella sp. IMCC34183]|uniref:hypothetical protein n=1 Tax=Lewinella sp. IMCC34183 TaxID=2248762 RepID=UPI000E2881EE|nr:hypothetical protein [Lewinella sp. IMCC34183]
MFYPLTLLLLLATAAGAQDYQPLDPRDPVDFRGSYLVYRGDTIRPGPRTFYVDGQLSAAEAAAYPYVFHSVQAAARELNAGSEEEPMTVYLAPYVYWIDDPDDPAVRVPKPGRPVPYGMEIACPWLRFVGLNRHPENVVLASNRGQTMGAKGNFTMFRFSGDGTAAENLTFGNYCNVDLDYPLAPALGRPRRGDAIVQAQLIHCDGDKIFARNVRFISRLNLCPFVGGRRTLFDSCHFESTDDALSGSAVYLNSTLTFFSSKPWYHTTGTGAVLLDCDVTVHTRGMQYFTKAGGQLAVVGTRFASDAMTGADWSDHPAPTTRNYQYAVTLNRAPLPIGGAGSPHTVPLAGAPVLDAYRFVHDGDTVYNVYNLLAGDDGWDPLHLGARVRRAERELGRPLTGLPVQLNLSPRTAALETGTDSLTVTATSLRFGNVPAAGTQVRWSVDTADADWVMLRPGPDGISCRVIPTNRQDTARQVILTASTPAGLRAASALTVRPARLPAPAFVHPPRLERAGPDAFRVSYTLGQLPYADVSDISWYRCADAACTDPIRVAVTRDDAPLRRYRLTAADAGWHLMAEVAPRHLRSDPGAPRAAVLERPLSAGEVPAPDAVIATDFSQEAVGDQPRVLPGFWTFRPLTVPDMKEPPPPGDTWMYGPGSAGSEGMTGLLQRGRTGSLAYTPVGEGFGDMAAQVTVTPFKTAGQGFSVAPLYMDILVKYDAGSKSGYGLRLTRGTTYGNAVEAYLIRYADGAVEALTERVFISGFRPTTTLELSVRDGVLQARSGTTAEYDARAYPAEVVPDLDLSVPIHAGPAGGFGIEYNGGSTTLINRVRLEWRR